MTHIKTIDVANDGPLLFIYNPPLSFLSQASALFTVSLYTDSSAHIALIRTNV